MKKISLFIIILSAVVLVVLPGTVQGIDHLPPPVQGIEFNPAVKIPNPDPDRFDFFGFFTSGVDIDGEIVIIGAPGDRYDPSTFLISGSAYLFDCSTDPCVLLDTLQNGKDFSYAVAISGSNVLIGAPGVGTTFSPLIRGLGAAYLYDCEDAIDAGDGSVPCDDPIEILSPAEVGNFGYYVELSGDTIVISNKNLLTSNSLTVFNDVFIYTCDDGTCILKDTLSNPTTVKTTFGISVAIDQDLVVVGDWDAGKAYFYDCTNFPCEDPVLLNPSSIRGFGWTVSISGDTVVVGSDSTDVAHVYDCSTTSCTLETILTSPITPSVFGYSVDIDGENVLVSDYRQYSAYLFDSSTGDLLYTFNIPGVTGDYGSAVAISGTNLIIGAQTDVSDSVAQAGSAYYYSEVEDSAIEVDIDVKPGSDPNSVNCKENKKGDINGIVPVAIFGADNFNVSTIDLESLQLNDVDVTEEHDEIHIENLNGDEFPDAVLHLDKAGVCEATADEEAYPLKESADAILTGSTTEDPSQDFEGTGDIRIVKR